MKGFPPFTLQAAKRGGRGAAAQPAEVVEPGRGELPLRQGDIKPDLRGERWSRTR